MKKYYIIIFGCQMNVSDSERVSAVLERLKYKKTLNINEADLVVVVMCSVRQSAVDRVRGFIKKFEQVRKSKPKLKTFLTGCVLKRDKKIFVKGFDYVVDVRNIKKLPEILQANPRRKLRDSVIFADTSDYLDITPKYTSKFSANVPIMTGCNNFCSYCVVPYVREREISRPAKEIISEIKNLIKNGYKEIWLLGQNVNSYKDKSTNFIKLLKMVNNIPGDFWIRFTSSHPKDFSNKLIDVMAECEKVTPYLNLPVQSGDDKVLRAMNRHYTVRDYENKIKKIREKIPGICLSTDIIVGFLGETKKQFENTAKLFRDIKFDMAYINKYSPRAGTVAAKLKDNVSIAEKKRREKVLTKILKQTALEANQKYIGKIVDVLVEGKKQASGGERSPVVNRAKRGSTTGVKNIWIGKSWHYKTIQMKSDKNLLGKFVKVEITEASPFILKGILK